jgi:hypothetical protein
VLAWFKEEKGMGEGIWGIGGKGEMGKGERKREEA